MQHTRLLNTPGWSLLTSILLTASSAFAYTPIKETPLLVNSTIAFYRYDTAQLVIDKRSGDGDIASTNDGVVFTTRDSLTATFIVGIVEETNDITLGYEYLLQGPVEVNVHLDGQPIQTFQRTLDAPYQDSSAFSIGRRLKPGEHRLSISIASLEKKPVRITWRELKFLSAGMLKSSVN
jgi:hypothetical protein